MQSANANASDNGSAVGVELLLNTNKMTSGNSDVQSIRSYSSHSDSYRKDGNGIEVKFQKPSKTGNTITKIKRSRRSSSSGSSYTSSSGSSTYSGSLASGSDTTSDSGSGSTISTNSPGSRRMSAEDIMNKKRELLYQLDRLERKGVKVPKKFTMASSLEEMQAEYDRLKTDRESEISVRFQRKMLMAIITGVEFLNSKFDPFDIKLDGWSESVNDQITEYDDVFEELYFKYRGKAKMAPEVKLMFMLSGSAFMFHLNNTMFRSAMPGIEQMMRQNPEFMKGGQMPPPPKQTSSPLGGLGGLMGGLFGGGGGLSSLFGAFGGGAPTMPPPPPQPSNNMMRPQMRGPTNVDDILNEINAPLNGMNQNISEHPQSMQDRIETMSTISDSELSEIPDDASMSGVFPRTKRISRGKTLNI